MEFSVGQDLTIKGYPTQDQALDASALSPTVRALVRDRIAVSPCWLRVTDGGMAHFFAAFVIETFDRTGRKNGDALLLALNKGDEVSGDFVWIPPKLLKGEQFSLEHFSRGAVVPVNDA